MTYVTQENHSVQAQVISRQIFMCNDSIREGSRPCFRVYLARLIHALSSEKGTKKEYFNSVRPDVGDEDVGRR